MPRLRLTALAGVLIVLAACASAEESDGATSPQDTLAGDVTVFAAASLTDALTEIGSEVERMYAGVTVTFNFAGSQQLATQIVEGAPADVFASANLAQMDVVADAGLVAGHPVMFARNRLQIVVEPGNPRRIATLRDLQRDGVTVVLAAPQVPAGRYARAALDRAGIALSPVSLETDVRAVLSKIALGEADAGIVYASDVAAAGDRVTGVEIPDAANVVATYPIAALDAAPNAEAAQAFVAAVRSEAGRAALARAGFELP